MFHDYTNRGFDELFREMHRRPTGPDFWPHSVARQPTYVPKITVERILLAVQKVQSRYHGGRMRTAAHGLDLAIRQALVGVMTGSPIPPPGDFEEALRKILASIDKVAFELRSHLTIQSMRNVYQRILEGKARRS